MKFENDRIVITFFRMPLESIKAPDMKMYQTLISEKTVTLQYNHIRVPVLEDKNNKGQNL